MNCEIQRRYYCSQNIFISILQVSHKDRYYNTKNKKQQVHFIAFLQQEKKLT